MFVLENEKEGNGRNETIVTAPQLWSQIHLNLAERSLIKGSGDEFVPKLETGAVESCMRNPDHQLEQGNKRE